MTFLYLKNDVNVPVFPILIRWILMFLVLPNPHLDPLVRGTYEYGPRIRTRIRIRTKMSRIRNRGPKKSDPTDPDPHRIRTKISRIRNTALHWSDGERVVANKPSSTSKGVCCGVSAALLNCPEGRPGHG
jgi:hypothetical protein